MRLRLIAGFLPLLIAIGANGASAGEYDPGLSLLRERQQTETLRRLRTAPQGAGIEAPPVSAGKSTICFQINTIRVEGNTVLRPGVLGSVVYPFRWKCLGQVEIEQLVAQVRKAYLSRGYITAQVTVPAQDLKRGTLILQVVEGKVSRLVYGQISEGEKPALAGTGKRLTAFPFIVDGPLQLRDLEQGVAQINRLPSRSASIDILPGADPGTSIVRVIEKDQRPWRASIGWDTQGQTVTGVRRLRASGEYDDLLSLNDSWSFGYSGSLSSNALAATFSVPFGYWTLSNSASYSEQDTPVSVLADVVSRSVNETIALDRVFYRDANLVVHVNQSLNWYWNQRYINEAKLEAQWLGWERTGIVIERYFDTARFSFDAGVSIGTPGLARTNDPGDIASDAAHARFTKIDATVTYLQSLPKNFSLIVTATGQYSADSLYSANQITIGGWDSVRGFRDANVSGDTGFYGRAELQWSKVLPWAREADDPDLGRPVAAPWHDLSLKGIARQLAVSVSPYVFVDGGSAYANATKTTDSLMSVGAGVRTGGERVSFEATAAVPVIRDSNKNNFEAAVSMTVKLW